MNNSRRRATKSNDVQFKIILIGKSAVGKSSLMTRYAKDIFQSDYQVTVGTKFIIEVWSLPPKSSKSTRASTANLSFGTQQDRKASNLLSKATIGTAQLSF